MIFCGSGSTGGDQPPRRRAEPAPPGGPGRRAGTCARAIPPSERPVVFIGPYEHHSNELPWRESHRRRRDDPRGPRRLHRPRPARATSWRRYADRPLKIGSFSAASNVTGIVSDTYEISRAAPRARRAVVLRLRGRRAVRLDRDGPAGRPARRTRTRCSSRPTSSSAGRGRRGARRPPGAVHEPGPVDARRRHRPVRQHRSSTCTSRTSSTARRAARPRSSSRSARGSCSSSRRPWASRRSASARTQFIGRALRRWEANPAIEILGSPRGGPAVDRVVRRPPPAASTCTTTSSSRCSTTCSGSSRAAAARAPGRTATGCSGSTSRPSHEFEREIARGCEGIKPGWVRVNFNYFISEAVFEFILDAVDLVATRGLAAAPRLRVRARRPACGATAPAGRSRRSRLHDIRYDDGRMAYPSHRHREPESRLAEYLAEARELLARPPHAARRAVHRPGRRGPGLRGPPLVPAPRGRPPRRRAAARVSERGPGAPGRRSWGWTSARPRRRRRSSGSTARCSGSAGRRSPRSTAPTAARSRIHATGGAPSRPRSRSIEALGGDGGRGRRDLRRGPGADARASSTGTREPTRAAITWQDRRIGGGGWGLLPKIALARATTTSTPAAEARWLLASWDALGLWLTGEAAQTLQGHETAMGARDLEAAGVRRAQTGDPLPFGTPLGALRADAAVGARPPAGDPRRRRRERRHGVDARGRAPRGGRRGRHRGDVGRHRHLRGPRGGGPGPVRRARAAARPLGRRRRDGVDRCRGGLDPRR